MLYQNVPVWLWPPIPKAFTESMSSRDEAGNVLTPNPEMLPQELPRACGCSQPSKQGFPEIAAWSHNPKSSVAGTLKWYFRASDKFIQMKNWAVPTTWALLSLVPLTALPRSGLTSWLDRMTQQGRCCSEEMRLQCQAARAAWAAELSLSTPLWLLLKSNQKMRGFHRHSAQSTGLK